MAGTREYGIKPYIDAEPDDTSYIDRNRKQTWENQLWTKEERHSELIKPYKHDDYQEMEHYYPEPLFYSEWPDSIPPTDTTLIRDREGTDFYPCFLSAIGNYSTKKCDDPLEVKWDVVSGSTARFDPRRWKVYSLPSNILLINRRKRQDILELKFNKGAVFPILFIPKSGSWSDLADYDNDFNPNYGRIKLKIEFEDPLGSTCTTEEVMYCRTTCTCPSGDFAFDDGSTSDTITPGGNITLVISGGCPPYFWSVSGTGYALDFTYTTELTNILRSADGDCGIDFDAQAVITVTDHCGDDVTFYIRNTDGQWTTVVTCNATYDNPPNDCTTHSCTTHANIVEENRKRWVFGAPNCYFDFQGTHWDCSNEYRPSCGTPFGCNTGELCSEVPAECCTDANPCGVCLPPSVEYQEWMC